MKKAFILMVGMILVPSISFAEVVPAQVSVINDSDFTLTVKVMTVAGKKYSQIIVPAQQTKTAYIYVSGTYYLKTKASAYNKDDLYSKGNFFKVVSSEEGYSMIKVTYKISGGTYSSGKSISKSEFDKDNDASRSSTIIPY